MADRGSLFAHQQFGTGAIGMIGHDPAQRSAGTGALSANHVATGPGEGRALLLAQHRPDANEDFLTDTARLRG